MNAASLLSELGAVMGLSNLAFNPEGCARLVFDEAVEVNFELDAASSRLQIYTVLGHVPAEGREGVFEMLLEGNLFGLETRGATLALDGVEGDIILCRTLDGDGLEASEFINLVGAFVDTAEAWRTRLRAGHAPEEEPAPAGSQNPFPNGFLRA